MPPKLGKPRTMTQVKQLFFAGSLFISVTVAASTVDREEVTIWNTIGAHDRVVRELSNYVWQLSSDPQLLIVYCDSQFTDSSGNLTCTLSTTSAIGAKQFAEALWYTWSGQTRKARNAFELLAKHREWSEWGNVGLLELAWYTEHLDELGRLLDSLESNSTKKSTAFTEILTRYRLHHAEATNNWDRILDVAEKYPLQRVVRNLPLFFTYARALFVDGRENQLRKLLEATPSALRETTEYRLRSAEYALLTHGISKSISAIQKYAASSPENDDLGLQKAYLEVLDSSPKVAAAALARIHRIAESSKHNVRLLIGIATTLASFHKPEESARVFTLIDPEIVDLEDFTMFYTLQAWVAIYRDEISEANSTLDRALAMFPQQVAANHLKALIAKRNNDPEAGTMALKNLFEADPYNENYASLVLYFRGRFTTADLEWLFQEVRLRQKYYGEVMRLRIQSSERRLPENR